MEAKNNNSCERIRALLLDPKATELDKSTKRHLDTCEQCREFQNTLILISNAARIGSEEHPQPDPRIISLLKSNFEKQSPTNGFLESLLALFQKRIPVYQILVAVFLAAIFYFSVTKISFSQADSEKASLDFQRGNQILQSVEFPTLPLQQDQQIGKSLSEDSLSARFRVSVL